MTRLHVVATVRLRPLRAAGRPHLWCCTPAAQRAPARVRRQAGPGP
jgi:hypothetical protein